LELGGTVKILAAVLLCASVVGAQEVTTVENSLEKPWVEMASPAAVPVEIGIPKGMELVGVKDVVTGMKVGYHFHSSTSAQTVTFSVADDPIEVWVQPRSAAKRSMELGVSLRARRGIPCIRSEAWANRLVSFRIGHVVEPLAFY
jgi:hypothetical protein